MGQLVEVAGAEEYVRGYGTRVGLVENVRNAVDRMWVIGRIR